MSKLLLECDRTKTRNLLAKFVGKIKIGAALSAKIMNPITPEVIAEATRRIAIELDPEEIILFGSYAWGTPHKYSDLDLCVIVADGIPGFNRIEWGVRGMNAVNDLMIDVDVMVTTREVIDTFKTVPASLTRKIVEQGKLLYAKC